MTGEVTGGSGRRRRRHRRPPWPPAEASARLGRRRDGTNGEERKERRRRKKKRKKRKERKRFGLMFFLRLGQELVLVGFWKWALVYFFFWVSDGLGGWSPCISGSGLSDKMTGWPARFYGFSVGLR